MLLKIEPLILILDENWKSKDKRLKMKIIAEINDRKIHAIKFFAKSNYQLWTDFWNFITIFFHLNSG